MHRHQQKNVSARAGRLHAARTLVAMALLAIPGLASAQTTGGAGDRWQVDIAPMYLWASEIDGRVAAGDRERPIFMSFGDAAEQLAGTFTVHVEARKRRWGVLGDVSFVRLTSDAAFTTPVAARTVEGSFKNDIIGFEGGASYLVDPESHFSVIGGVRTYTFGIELEFEGAARELTPIDDSRTAVSAFGGFTYRPRLSEKWTLLARGDVGGGSAFTWSGTLGFDYRMKPWGSLGFGFRALGVDTGEAAAATGEVEYDVTHYGPIIGLTLHFNRQ